MKYIVLALDRVVLPGGGAVVHEVGYMVSALRAATKLYHAD